MPQAPTSGCPIYTFQEITVTGNGEVKTIDFVGSDGLGNLHLIEVSTTHKGYITRRQAEYLSHLVPQIHIFGWSARYQANDSKQVHLKFKLQQPSPTQLLNY
jgi:hypothetical protein